MAQFAELVSTAISNIESRVKVERLAAEQSALRRVATLVAREHSPEDLFATLAQEVGVLLEVDASAILRYEPDSEATVVAGWSDGTVAIPIGRRFPLVGENLSRRSRTPERLGAKRTMSGAPGPIAATVRELGIRAAVASPIVVEAVTWGVIAVLSRDPGSLAPNTEARLAEFSRVPGWRWRIQRAARTSRNRGHGSSERPTRRAGVSSGISTMVPSSDSCLWASR